MRGVIQLEPTTVAGIVVNGWDLRGLRGAGAVTVAVLTNLTILSATLAGYVFRGGEILVIQSEY